MGENQKRTFCLEDLKGLKTDPKEEEKLRQSLRMLPMPFGRYKGTPVKSLPTGYVKWLRDWLRERDTFDDLLDAVEIELRARGHAG